MKREMREIPVFLTERRESLIKLLGQKIAEINSNFIAGNHNIRILNFCIISYKFVHFCETDWYKLIWMGKKKKIV